MAFLKARYNMKRILMILTVLFFMAPNAKANDLQPENVQTTLSMEELLTISPEYSLTASEMFIENYSNGEIAKPKKWWQKLWDIVKPHLKDIIIDFIKDVIFGEAGPVPGGDGLGTDVGLNLDVLDEVDQMSFDGANLIVEEDIYVAEDDETGYSAYIQAGTYPVFGEDNFHLIFIVKE